MLRRAPPAGTPGHGHIGGEHGYDFGKCPEALPETASAEEGEAAREYMPRIYTRFMKATATATANSEVYDSLRNKK